VHWADRLTRFALRILPGRLAASPVVWILTSRSVQLRRHDYTVDILGGATGLNYASDYVDAGGIMVARQRRVYAYEGDYQIVKDPVLVAIDMSQITVSR
jgi:hypothetical protein